VRYYKIDITKADGTPFLFKSLGIPLTSLLQTGPQNPISGIANPGALNVEFEIPFANLTDPSSNSSWLRIWGLGLQDIGNAADLNGLSISISAGMSRGLPLANPAQAGLIMQGTIFQAYGNWINTDQTIDINFFPAATPVKPAPSSPTSAPQSTASAPNQTSALSGAPNQNAGVSFSWKASQPLSSAISNVLSIAMPGYTPVMEISEKLVQNFDAPGVYQSLGQFADHINKLSRSIIGGSYRGVTMAVNGSTVRVFDGSVPTPAGGVKQIAFQDMIGQPTWQDDATISLKLVLRADINMGDVISIPPNQWTISSGSAAFAQQKNKSPDNSSSFSGNYKVTNGQYHGNFRQGDAASWNTTLQLFPELLGTNTAPSPSPMPYLGGGSAASSLGSA
jgi:hypothetical protein